MASAKSGAVSKFFVWAIILMLVVGLGGFGVSNFGGGAQVVATAGDREITAQEYYDSLNQELNVLAQSTGQRLTLAQADPLFESAYGSALSDQVLDQLILQAAMDAEASRLGISVGDLRVRDQLLQLRRFQGLDGNFDETAYRAELRRTGTDPRAYEDGIRNETVRTLIQAATLAGSKVSATQLDTVVGFAAQRRSFTWARLDHTHLPTPLPAPTEAELLAYYTANPDDFTAPATKDISFVWLIPDQLMDDVELDDADVRALYDARSDEFITPERRLVERLVFGDAEEASAAAARLDAGDITYDALVAERGLDLADVDMGDVRLGTLSAEAGAGVFALEGPGETGVLMSALGPAIFRVNGILAAQETTFEQVEPTLRLELSGDRARRIIDNEIENITDLLAGGASLEEIAAETEMQLDTISWWDGLGDGIAAYNGFRDQARDVSEDDFPEIVVLDDGGIFALRLDGVTAPTLEPLDAVRTKVVNGWEAEQTDLRLTEVAQTFIGQIALGVQPEDLGLAARREEALTRGSYIDGAPEGFSEHVFEMEAGSTDVLPGLGAVYLVQLNEVLAADLEDSDTMDVAQSLEDALSQQIAQDIFAAWSQDRLGAATVSRDNGVIAAIRAQVP